MDQGETTRPCCCSPSSFRENSGSTMATMTATNGHTNSDDEDLSVLRPVDIDQDVREMERRKRVEAIMSSKLFREELERVVGDSLKVVLSSAIFC